MIHTEHIFLLRWHESVCVCVCGGGVISPQKVFLNLLVRQWDDTIETVHGKRKSRR